MMSEMFSFSLGTDAILNTSFVSMENKEMVDV